MIYEWNEWNHFQHSQYDLWLKYKHYQTMTFLIFLLMPTKKVQNSNVRLLRMISLSTCLITKSCSILRQWQFLVVTHLLLFVNASPLWFCNFLVYFQLDISRLSKHHVLLKSILRKIGYKLRSCLWAWTLYGGVGGQGNT